MPELSELWTEYRATGNKACKDKLLVEYAGLVKYIAQRVSMNLPASVEFDRGDIPADAAVRGVARGRGTRTTTFTDDTESDP